MVKFGTGGWRAIIGDEFTRENIRLVSAGLCALMEKDGHAGATVCVGYDRRFLSKESAHWAAEVLAGYGFKPVVVRRSSPTPLIMFTVKERKLPYGMCITASHNPAIYNGIKVFTEGGRDADRDVTCRIEEEMSRIAASDVKSVDYDEAVADGRIEEIYPFNDYIDSILNFIDMKSIKNAQLRIALDPMYGVSQKSLQTILMTCRCDVDVINAQHDTLFGGHMPAPSKDALKTLSNYVAEHRCNLGLATDGDADRLGVMDENGNYIHPNTLLVLLYYYLVKYRGWSGPCVRNNSTTCLLDRVAKDFGQECYEVPVGFKWVSAKMTETGAIVGGESSGGMAVRGHIAGKDGIYAASLLVEMLAVTGKSVSELYQEILDIYGELYYEDAAFTMTPAHKACLQDLIFNRKQLPDFGREIDHIDYSDGCKVWFADGSWIICRFSGTEPLLRMAAESEDRETALADIRCWKKFLSL